MKRAPAHVFVVVLLAGVGCDQVLLGIALALLDPARTPAQAA